MLFGVLKFCGFSMFEKIAETFALAPKLVRPHTDTDPFHTVQLFRRLSCESFFVWPTHHGPYTYACPSCSYTGSGSVLTACLCAGYRADEGGAQHGARQGPTLQCPGQRRPHMSCLHKARTTYPPELNFSSLSIHKVTCAKECTECLICLGTSCIHLCPESRGLICEMVNRVPLSFVCV